MDTQTWYVATVTRAWAGIGEYGRDAFNMPLTQRYTFARGDVIAIKLQENGRVLVYAPYQGEAAIVDMAWARERLQTHRLGGRAIEYSFE
ncbi:MAG: hypothetical protein PHO41_10935 [Eubacteriales bacterium]|nr:hypothetical protein [Eubacteriales bacterium]